MNETIKSMLNHRSIRAYKDEPVTDQDLNLLLEVALQAPTSINGQQLSIIVVRDKEKKAKIAELTGGQTWIDQAPVFLLFVMDYHRAAIAAKLTEQEFIHNQSIESIMVGSVDVGIAMGTVIAAAESMGLGTVPIGGIRRAPFEMIELFNLPQFVYPVAGVALGHIADHSAKKPRIPMSIFRHDERYNPDQEEAIKAYDEQMSAYMSERTGGQSNRNWSQGVAGTYKHIYFPKVYPSLKQQGFDNDK